MGTEGCHTDEPPVVSYAVKTILNLGNSGEAYGGLLVSVYQLQPLPIRAAFLGSEKEEIVRGKLVFAEECISMR